MVRGFGGRHSCVRAADRRRAFRLRPAAYARANRGRRPGPGPEIPRTSRPGNRRCRYLACHSLTPRSSTVCAAPTCGPAAAPATTSLAAGLLRRSLQVLKAVAGSLRPSLARLWHVPCAIGQPVGHCGGGYRVSLRLDAQAAGLTPQPCSFDQRWAQALAGRASFRVLSHQLLPLPRSSFGASAARTSTTLLMTLSPHRSSVQATLQALCWARASHKQLFTCIELPLAVRDGWYSTPFLIYSWLLLQCASLSARILPWHAGWSRLWRRRGGRNRPAVISEVRRT